MTVKELIELLCKEDKDRIVVMSSDEEGNGFSELCAIETAMYDPKSRETGLEKLTKSLKDQGYTDEDVMTCGKKAIVLWP
jgi:hypothetical protein